MPVQTNPVRFVAARSPVAQPLVKAVAAERAVVEDTLRRERIQAPFGQRCLAPCLSPHKIVKPGEEFKYKTLNTNFRVYPDILFLKAYLTG